MGPADLDNIGERARFFREAVAKVSQRGEKTRVDGDRRGDVDSGRNYVVTGLTAIDVIVLMSRLPGTRGQARDHFIRIHVGRGTASGLEDIDHELGIVVAARNGFSGGFDRGGLRGRQLAELGIRSSGSGFDQSESVDKLALKSQAADGEIFDS